MVTCPKAACEIDDGILNPSLCGDAIINAAVVVLVVVLVAVGTGCGGVKSDGDEYVLEETSLYVLFL